MTALREAYDGLRFDVIDTVEQDEHVAARWVQHGVQRKPIFGREPDRKAESRQGMVFYRLRDGRFVEQWLLLDVMP